MRAAALLVVAGTLVAACHSETGLSAKWGDEDLPTSPEQGTHFTTQTTPPAAPEPPPACGPDLPDGGCATVPADTGADTVPEPVDPPVDPEPVDPEPIEPEPVEPVDPVDPVPPLDTGAPPVVEPPVDTGAVPVVIDPLPPVVDTGAVPQLEPCDPAGPAELTLDPVQIPGDGRVAYCHSIDGVNYGLVESSVASCMAHQVHGYDLFPSTGCDS
jgi:hypothetical protein